MIFNKYFALTAAFAIAAFAQAPSILTIDMENVVQYQENFANLARNGSSTAMEPAVTNPATFFPATFIGDIVAVNGRRTKGATMARNYWVGMSANPTGSQAIGDVNRIHPMDIHLEILQADGTPVGTIVLSGVTAGPGALGAPKVGVTGAFVILGGTGAFLGVRGQASTIMNNHRGTSTFENPINRRTYPSGLWKMVLQLIPMRTPEILSTAAGPVIVHAADNAPVTAANPARAGEVLTLIATGLGPTRPGVDPGQVFTANPAQVVTSPIEVIVNGKAGEVLYSGGYPGTADSYQVNFRMPAELTPGQATIRLNAAWIVGSEAKLSVQ